MPDGHDPYAALRHRDFRRLLLGSVCASVASEMQAIAVGWELYERTESKAALGYVGLVQFLPVLFLSLAAGQAADRYSRKGLLAWSQMMAAGASLGLACLSFQQGPVWAVYLCLLVAGIARAFSAPARWSLVPAVVPAVQLNNAVTWNSSSWQFASVAGPALGGLVIAQSGAASGVYLLAAGCAVTCAALVASIRPHASPSGEPPSLASLLAGAQFVYRTKPILATITLDLFAVLLGGATFLLPVFAHDILEIGPVGLGWLRAAPSLGALVMAFVLAHRRPLQRPGWTMLWAVAGFGGATIVFGLSTNVVLSFTMLALAGGLDTISMVVRGTLVQTLTPDALRGRVSAVNAVFIGSSNELGGFESGMTAEWFGPIISVVGGGLGTIAVVILVMLIWPEVLHLGPLQGHKAKDRDNDKAREKDPAEA
jgi:MFS family permease